ncbi:MAG: signal peptidase II [Deltaproteobacteria bacterium]|nr:signal peptidase II [Deltaproteobacteria bacterium]MBW2578524.1 signal peptidase II [Deltaproteobacteria bacterium]MBW2693921.1 signal peptidase II [Deltaproteobacteria bacterium]
MTPKFRIAAGAFLIVLVLDLATKIAIDMHLSYADRIPVIPGFFYLTHVRNTGAAFGLFSDAPQVYRLSFFISVSLIAVGIIVSFFRKLSPGDRLAALALGLILGGAVGNLIDRIFRQEVVDFLHFRLWRGYSWPDFNVADSAIVVGVGLLVLELLASEGEQRSSAGDGESNS